MGSSVANGVGPILREPTDRRNVQKENVSLAVFVFMRSGEFFFFASMSRQWVVYNISDFVEDVSTFWIVPGRINDIGIRFRLLRY